jgi:Glycosyltransferase family 87
MKKMWSCLAVLALAGLVASFVFEANLRSKVSRTDIDVPDLSGQSGGVVEKCLQFRRDQHVSDLAMTLEFYFDSLEGHENLFQTSDANQGIRFEFASPATAALLIGNAETGQLIALHLSQGLQPSTWNQFGMHLKPGEVTAHLNQLTRYRDFSEVKVRYDRLLVGSGFSGSRPFRGRIRNVHVEISVATERPYAARALVPGRFLLAGLALAFCFLALPLPQMSPESRVEALAAIVVIGFGIAVVFHYAAANYHGLSYPWTSFCYLPGDAFSDFYDSFHRAADRNPYNTEGGAEASCYPPFCFTVLYPLTLLPPFAAFALVTGVTVTFLLVFTWRMLPTCDTWTRVLAAFALSFLTYPVLMLLDRGNLDGLLFVLMGVFVWAYQKGHYRSGVVLLAVASALKIFPALFVLVYVADRRYRQAALMCVLTALLTVIGMVCLKGGVAQTLDNYRAAVAASTPEVASTDRCLQFTSTLYGLIHALSDLRDPEACQRLYAVYQYVCAGLLVVLAGYLVWVEKSFTRRVSLLTLTMLLLPAFNYDYRLIFLYIPLALFLGKRPGRLDPLYLAFYALLLVPKAYFMIRGWVSISVVVNPLLMVGLVGLNLYERFAAARLGIDSEGSDAPAVILQLPASRSGEADARAA